MLTMPATAGFLVTRVFLTTSWILLLLLLPSSSVVYASMPSSSTTTTTTTASHCPTQLVIGVDGGTESIRACCVHAETGRVVGRSCAVPYRTTHPGPPGWAEQDPVEWYHDLVQAVRGALQSVDEILPHYRVRALCVDTTCCSVVALANHHHHQGHGDGNNEQQQVEQPEQQQLQPLRPCLLWMDQRAAAQTRHILETCRDDPALMVNCDGQGPLSAEWMLPKALWIHDVEPDVWQQATTICEYQDYINYRLTGQLVASSCNAATRWHWDGRQASLHPNDPTAGRPLSLYQALGIPELATKLPQRCVAMGTVIGGLTPQAAGDLWLPVDLPVVQGGPDAFVGMIGLGCVQAGQLCLITGSSHLHCVVTDTDRTAPGIWGAYRGAPLPDLYFAEGGQSSTGSLLRWARQLFGGDECGDADLSYVALDKMAANIPPGADGLLALETFQGSRTPVTDSLAKGALLGLTLSHTRAHIWRALMEAVCFGTRACMEGLAAAGHDCKEIILAGGIAKSQLWLQMHADVTGKPVVVCENTDAPLLGCAILAAVGIGIHKTVPDAIEAMVRVAKRIEPNPEAHALYSRIYETAYQPMVKSVRDISHALHSLRGGAKTVENTADQQTGAKQVIISPSLLACDWGNMRQEVQRCLQAGAHRLHVDVFDGAFLDSPRAFTFGPDMVKVIRDSLGDATSTLLDLHMCVHDPSRFVDVMAEVAPRHCFIFQWEAVPSVSEAKALAQRIVESGMQCGVSLNPSTSVEVLWPLLETGLVSVVDLLAVEPGFGGQQFQASVLSKVSTLRQWLRNNQADKESPTTQILVDGGVNDETAASVIEAGADILVSGSFLFRQDLKQGIETLLQQPSQ